MDAREVSATILRPGWIRLANYPLCATAGQTCQETAFSYEKTGQIEDGDSYDFGFLEGRLVFHGNFGYGYGYGYERAYFTYKDLCPNYIQGSVPQSINDRNTTPSRSMVQASGFRLQEWAHW
jgi:hypothetical protein